MNKLILLILFLFGNYNFSEAQNLEINKKNITQILESNAKGTTFNWDKKKWSDGHNSTHFSLYNVWITCNDDSSYYKSDTIKLYNYQYYYFNLDCVWLKKWIVEDKNEIILADSKPPLGITKSGSKIIISEKKSVVRIKIFEGNQILESFVVIDLTLEFPKNKDKYYVMSLIRE